MDTATLLDRVRQVIPATTPISRWRVEQWAWAVLRDHVLGPLPPDWTVRIPQMQRLFGSSTTTRLQQAATTVAWLAACNRAGAA